MMKNNLVYYIMTYIMFLYPPFIYFMVMINFDDISDQNTWIIGIIVNVILVLITTLILYLLALKKKIPKIESDEKNHVIFGYIGNLIVFLYVYQYLMNIEMYVSVFSLVFILVLAYKYLISKKVSFKEILIFSIVFGVIDYIVIIFSGNTLFNEYVPFTDAQSITFQIFLLGALLFTIGWYGLKLYRNHHWNVLRYVLLGFIVASIFTFYADMQEEVIATIAIISVFTWLIDIILRLIHKEFKVTDLVFYARLIMLVVVILMIKVLDLYEFPNFDIEMMFLLISIFYVTAFSDIIMNITPKKQEAINLNLTVTEYIKQLYNPVTSRYKDVLVFTKCDMLDLDLSKLGRNIILKHDMNDIEQFEKNSLSFVIVYEDELKDIERIRNQFGNLNICVISAKNLTNPLFKSSYTDYQNYIYTL